jgi:hypothetical protein
VSQEPCKDCELYLVEIERLWKELDAVLKMIEYYTEEGKKHGSVSGIYSSKQVR